MARGERFERRGRPVRGGSRARPRVRWKAAGRAVWRRRGWPGSASACASAATPCAAWAADNRLRGRAGARGSRRPAGKAGNWACCACRGGAEVHHRLGVVVDPCVRGEALGGFPQRPGHLRFAGIAVLRQVARQYALDVAVEDRCAQAHRQAGDGSSGGAADAGQFGELLDVAGNSPACRSTTICAVLCRLRARLQPSPVHRCRTSSSAAAASASTSGNAAMKRSK